MGAENGVFSTIFIGQEVEVVLGDYSATTSQRGITYPNEGTLVGYDSNGVVLQKGRNKDQYAFFPFENIRCINLKTSSVVNTTNEYVMPSSEGTGRTNSGAPPVPPSLKRKIG